MLHKEDVPETVFGRHIIGIGRKFRAKILFRLLHFALAEVNHAPAIIGLRQFRIQLESARKFLQGLVVLLVLGMGLSEEKVDLRRVRVLHQHTAKNLARAG